MARGKLPCVGVRLRDLLRERRPITERGVQPVHRGAEPALDRNAVAREKVGEFTVQSGGFFVRQRPFLFGFGSLVLRRVEFRQIAFQFGKRREGAVARGIAVGREQSGEIGVELRAPGAFHAARIGHGDRLFERADLPLEQEERRSTEREYARREQERARDHVREDQQDQPREKHQSAADREQRRRGVLLRRRRGGDVLCRRRESDRLRVADLPRFRLHLFERRLVGATRSEAGGKFVLPLRRGKPDLCVARRRFPRRDLRFRFGKRGSVGGAALETGVRFLQFGFRLFAPRRQRVVGRPERFRSCRRQRRFALFGVASQGGESACVVFPRLQFGFDLRRVGFRLVEQTRFSLLLFDRGRGGVERVDRLLRRDRPFGVHDGFAEPVGERLSGRRVERFGGQKDRPGKGVGVDPEQDLADLAPAAVERRAVTVDRAVVVRGALLVEGALDPVLVARVGFHDERTAERPAAVGAEMLAVVELHAAPIDGRKPEQHRRKERRERAFPRAVLAEQPRKTRLERKIRVGEFAELHDMTGNQFHRSLLSRFSRAIARTRRAARSPGSRSWFLREDPFRQAGAETRRAARVRPGSRRGRARGSYDP